jgi:hypothetical protein
MGINELYYELEDKSADINLHKFQEFIDNFYNAIGNNLDKLVVSDIGSDCPIEKFYYIKYLVCTYLKKYREVFYQVLESTGYNMKSELIDMMKLMGKTNDAKYDGELLNYVLENPYVNCITFDGDVIIIRSDKLGDISFISPSTYFKNNSEALNIVNGKTDHLCHLVSSELLECVDNSKIITSLMPSYFEGTYLHSYIKDDKGFIIDGANQVVLLNDDYNRLFEPSIITECSKEELYKAYVEALKSGRVKESEGYYIPVAVALDKKLMLGGK